MIDALGIDAQWLFSIVFRASVGAALDASGQVVATYRDLEVPLPSGTSLVGSLESAAWVEMTESKQGTINCGAHENGTK
jgi:hypothetical protein